MFESQQQQKIFSRGFEFKSEKKIKEMVEIEYTNLRRTLLKYNII